MKRLYKGFGFAVGMLKRVLVGKGEKLIKYRSNVHSQNGEDGVLEKIFSLLQHVLPAEKWCVEFGACDGKRLSNTFNLVQQDWNAVYIEGDSRYFEGLALTVKQYPKIVPIKAMVGFEKGNENCLDKLLEKTKIPDDYELLSIDINSYDLAVWQAYSGKPKVAVVEINPNNLMPGVMQWHNGSSAQGNSFSSTLAVAKEKGYELVCHTESNMIFVRRDLVRYLGLDAADLQFPERLYFYHFLSSTWFFIAMRLLPNCVENLIKRLIFKISQLKHNV